MSRSLIRSKAGTRYFIQRAVVLTSRKFVDLPDLKIRPIYHRLQRRIEAHICISFAAYKLYKELERKLYEKNAKFSPLTAIEIAENIFEITIRIQESNTEIKKLLLLTEEQKYLAKLPGF